MGNWLRLQLMGGSKWASETFLLNFPIEKGHEFFCVVAKNFGTLYGHERETKELHLLETEYENSSEEHDVL